MHVGQRGTWGKSDRYCCPLDRIYVPWKTCFLALLVYLPLAVPVGITSMRLVEVGGGGASIGGLIPFPGWDCIKQEAR